MIHLTRWMAETREKSQREHVTRRCVRDDGRSRYEVIIERLTFERFLWKEPLTEAITMTAVDFIGRVHARYTVQAKERPVN